MIDRFGIHSAYLYMSLWKLTDSIFFFNDTATTEIYTLSLHDALPISIRLLRPDQLAALAAERTKQTAERPKPPPKATLAACLELGAFAPGDVARVQQALEPLGLGSRLSQRRVDEIASYWVFMPPQRNRQAANQKAAELRKLGVEDFFIVQEDPNFRLAISLGVFKTEE